MCYKTRSITISVILYGAICGLLFMFAVPGATRRKDGLQEMDARVFASRAVNNTVVVVPVNTGMMHWADNLLCSLSQTSFNTSNIVFWALDAAAKDTLQGRGFAAYHDPALFSTSNNENLRGDTKAYKRMMRERPKFFIDVLMSGFDILMLDADTVYWQSPLEIIPRVEDNYVDIVFSTDAREFYQTHNAFEDAYRRGSRMPPVCNGIFWMKSNPQTIAVWTKMREVFRTPWPLGPLRRWGFQDDQRGMDVLLNDGRARLVEPFPGGIDGSMVSGVQSPKATLKVRLLDQTQVVNGYLLRNRHVQYQKNLAELRAAGQGRIGAHFNWNTRGLSKEDGARAMGMYYLDDDGHCKLNS